MIAQKPRPTEITCSRHKSLRTHERTLRETTISQGKNVVKFSFDLNESFSVGSLGCQEQSNFF
jgi:hypothetical protein